MGCIIIKATANSLNCIEINVGLPFNRQFRIAFIHRTTIKKSNNKRNKNE